MIRLQKIAALAVTTGLLLQVITPCIALYANTPAQQYRQCDVRTAAAPLVEDNDNTIDISTIKTLLFDMANDICANNMQQQMSPAFKACVQQLEQGATHVLISDAVSAMPEIFSYAVEKYTRAPRPDGFNPAAPNAIVGPGACDLTQLLELLVAIKNKIGCVSDDVCCNTILGVLGDACNILGVSISQELLDIFTTMSTDFSGVFTALDACCEGIFTTLDNLVVSATVDLSGVFTALNACCEGVFTVLANLDACGPIAITTVPFVITESGSYCLAQDVTVPGGATGITITANDVTLNLSEHTISGGTNGIHSQGNRVRIENGRIVGATGRGILADGGGFLTFTNLLVNNNANNNIEINGINNIVINDCQASFGRSANVNNVNTILIRNSIFNNNTVGIALSSCQNIVLENTITNNNTASGINLLGCENIQISGATAFSNSENGILIHGNCNDTTLDMCNASLNSNIGISIENSASTTIKNCTANNNDVRGISLDSSST